MLTPPFAVSTNKLFVDFPYVWDMCEPQEIAFNRTYKAGPWPCSQNSVDFTIRFCFDYFCLDIIWKVILKKELKRGFYKRVKAELDSPRRELSNDGLGFVATLLFF